MYVSSTPFRLVTVGENSRTVRLGVERVKGQTYEVSVAYSTEQVVGASQLVAGSLVHPALDGQDFRGQTGSLLFPAGSQELKFIEISLTPVLASSSPLPKQFTVRLSAPTNGASIHPSPESHTATVRIVRHRDVDIWNTLPVDGADGVIDDADILTTIGQLDAISEGSLSEENINLIEHVLSLVNQEGAVRK